MARATEKKRSPSGARGRSRGHTRAPKISAPTTLLLVNMIPRSLSGETEQDSEPSIAVDPSNSNQIVGSAFTPDPMGGPSAPIFVSTDGGSSWFLRSTVPSNVQTGDISPRFGGGGRLYAGSSSSPGTSCSTSSARRARAARPL